MHVFFYGLRDNLTCSSINSLFLSLFCIFFIALEIIQRKKNSSHETLQTSAQLGIKGKKGACGAPKTDYSLIHFKEPTSFECNMKELFC